MFKTTPRPFESVVNFLCRMFGGDYRYMAGTEGTGEYDVFAGSSLGRAGSRALPSGHYRIRVEPVGDVEFPALSREEGWKQPGDGGQSRYSKVVQPDDLKDATRVVKQALRGPNGHRKIIEVEIPSFPSTEDAFEDSDFGGSSEDNEDEDEYYGDE